MLDEGSVVVVERAWRNVVDRLDLSLARDIEREAQPDAHRVTACVGCAVALAACSLAPWRAC